MVISSKLSTQKKVTRDSLILHLLLVGLFYHPYTWFNAEWLPIKWIKTEWDSTLTESTRSQTPWQLSSRYTKFYVFFGLANIFDFDPSASTRLTLSLILHYLSRGGVSLCEESQLTGNETPRSVNIEPDSTLSYSRCSLILWRVTVNGEWDSTLS